MVPSANGLAAAFSLPPSMAANDRETRETNRSLSTSCRLAMVPPRNEDNNVTQQMQGAAAPGAAPSPAVLAITPPSRGLWRDSAGAYSLGSLAATLVEALVLILVVWPSSAGWGGGILLALMLMGAAAALVLIPLASWFAWICTPPGLTAALRWLLLTVIASLVSLAVVLVAAIALRVIDLWIWLAVPVAGLHAWWTALFLVARRRAAIAPGR